MYFYPVRTATTHITEVLWCFNIQVALSCLPKSFCILECQNPAMAEECLALASEVRFRILPDQNCTVLSNEILTLTFTPLLKTENFIYTRGSGAY